MAFFSSKLTYNHSRFAWESEGEMVEGKLQTVKGAVVQIVVRRVG